MTDEELRALVASNARAIQGNANAIAELRENITQQGVQITELRESITQQGVQIAQQNEQMTQGIAEVVAMVGELAAQQESRHAESDQRFNNLLEDARADRQRSDQNHAEAAQRFDNLLTDARADRQRADQNHAEAMQRIDQALAEARADRERSDRDRAINENEHRAFRETFQTLLAEVTRIWQRLAG